MVQTPPASPRRPASAPSARPSKAASVRAPPDDRSLPHHVLAPHRRKRRQRRRRLPHSKATARRFGWWRRSCTFGQHPPRKRGHSLGVAMRMGAWSTRCGTSVGLSVASGAATRLYRRGLQTRPCRCEMTTSSAGWPAPRIRASSLSGGRRGRSRSIWRVT
eukprot:7162983-Prymnesium_polylepis.2